MAPFRILLASISLGGCGVQGQALYANVSSKTSPEGVVPINAISLYSAAPLSKKFDIGSGLTGAGIAITPDDKELFRGAVLQDSLEKCNFYVNTITSGQAVQNTFWDIISFATAGLATVFIPVNTVRALAAASTISQGSKTAINNDFFQTLTLVIFAQQIEESYYQAYKDFLRDHPTVVSLPTEIANIEGFHRYCSITFAAMKISASIPPPKLSLNQTNLFDNSKFKSMDGKTYQIVKTDKTWTINRIDDKNVATEFLTDQTPDQTVQFLTNQGAQKFN